MPFGPTSDVTTEGPGKQRSLFAQACMLLGSGLGVILVGAGLLVFSPKIYNTAENAGLLSHTSIRKVYFGTYGSWMNGELKDCVTTHTDANWLGCDGNRDTMEEGRTFKITFDHDPNSAKGEFQDWQCSKNDEGISCKVVKTGGAK
jgi:hypothetical protein